MKLKAPSKTEVIAIRHKKNANSGSILELPEDFISGFENRLTEHRFLTVVSAPEGAPVKEGDCIVAHEMDQEVIDRIEGETYVKVPSDYIQAIRDASGRLQPLENRVIVKPDPAPDTTTGGIYIPDTVRRPSNKATVLEKGKDCKYLNPGARIVFHPTMGLALNSEFYGGEVKILREIPVIEEIDSVLGVLDE